MKKLCVILLFIAYFTNFTSAQSKSGVHILKKYAVPGTGKWDYLSINPAKDKLYISHGTNVDVINIKSGSALGTLKNTDGVHGIAFDAEIHKGFTSNGHLNNVFVFDTDNHDTLAAIIPTGKNPDAIMYDNYSKKIFVCNGGSNSLSVIDPVNEKLDGDIAVGGKPETAVSDGAGKLFVNVEDKNEIVVIDVAAMKVLNHWSISPGEGPTGLAYDAHSRRLFAGCENMLIVLDAVTGKLVSSVPIGDHCDGVAFDPSLQNIYTSNGEGTLSVIHERDANHFDFVENIPTVKGARTLTIDTDSHFIYLPAPNGDAGLDVLVIGR